ncbi:MAG: DUF1801 domain-containing protein [Phycisphaerales bacterium]|nr:DUF1801 domain-containing protein [Phycisphaerales bacterium]
MDRKKPPASPDAYVNALRGWKRECVESLRAVALKVRGLEEGIKWGHLVYSCNGPVLLIRAEEERVLFGFWRGQRLGEIEPRLKPGGKYEMATLELRRDITITPTVARRLIRAAVELNRELGDPTDGAGGAKTGAKKAARPAGKRG